MAVDVSLDLVASPTLPDGKTPLSAPAVRTIGSVVGGFLLLDSYRGLSRNGTTDDSSAYAIALDDAMRIKCALWHGPGPICLKGGTALPVLNGVALVGESVDCQQPPYGSRGTSFWIYDRSHTAFPLQSNVRMSGLTFYWPGQQETGNPPVAYPPLFGGSSSTQGFTACSFENLRITNAYDIWVADQVGQAVGDISVRNVRACALNDVFRISNVPEIISVSDCLFSYESFDYAVNQYGVTNPTFGLRDWVTLNGSVFHVRNCASGQVAFFKVSNCYVYGFGRPIHVESTGRIWFDLNAVSFDGCRQVLQLESGGDVVNSSHSSGQVYPYRPGHEDQLPPLWNIQGPGICNLRLGGELEVQGVGTPLAAVVAVTSSAARLDIALRVTDFTPGTNCKVVAITSDSGGIYRIEGMRVIPVGGSYVGINIANSSPQLVWIRGNYFHAPANSVIANSGGPAFHIVDNSSLYTSGSSDVVLSGTASAKPGAWNGWSKP